MEKTAPPVAFPLLKERVDYSYRACTIPYRFPSDPSQQATTTELVWIQLFRKAIPSFRKQAELDDTVKDAPARAAKFADRFTQILDDLEADPQSHGGPPDCVLLCRLREMCLHEAGFRDIFKKVKDVENAKALCLFEQVVTAADSIKDDGDRLEHLVRGIFAGNIFDLGSAELAESYSNNGVSFLETFSKLLPRPWVIDDLEKFKLKWLRRAWKKAVIFVDNAGVDVVLGILPFARELLRRGTKVVIAANDMPSINDITYPEVVEILSKLKAGQNSILGVDCSNLLVINSGNDLPVIDLSCVSQELAFVAADADLVVLEGMGRSIETNLYAEFECDSLKLGMVKHPEVAEFLGGRQFDCVIRFTEVI